MSYSIASKTKMMCGNNLNEVRSGILNDIVAVLFTVEVVKNKNK